MTQDFKSLRVWNLARELTKEIYTLTEKFPVEEKYGIVQQLRRASTSIGANIAEGCGKKSSKEFMQYLRNSLGSAKEIEHFLIISSDLQYLDPTDYTQTTDKLISLSKMLSTLIKRIEERN